MIHSSTAHRDHPASLTLPPLALYVHVPWCVRKCPYCDFNSHARTRTLPARAYLRSLQQDLLVDLAYLQDRPLQSIFIGGGTPSLMPPWVYQALLEFCDRHCRLAPDIEITMEANPGTSEYHNLHGLRRAGINRLSFGAQSFDDTQLAKLGRIHTSAETYRAFHAAREAGFDNINLDLMHSLPGQNPDAALRDIQIAAELKPEHLSWYQLTIEPNTAFYNQPPPLPDEDTQADILERGLDAIFAAGFKAYEISAYARPGYQSRHNLNYWRFGDYLGIGAGAHGKITQCSEGRVLRYQKTRRPEDYLKPDKPFCAKRWEVSESDRVLEFFMNALRLYEAVPLARFEQLCGLPIARVAPILRTLEQRGLLEWREGDELHLSALGRRFLNNVLEAFLDTQNT